MHRLYIQLPGGKIIKTLAGGSKETVKQESIFIKLLSIIECILSSEEVDSNPQEVSMPKKRCPNCRSINTQRCGSYRTKSLRASGKRQRRIPRYYCLDCHTSFSERAEAKSTKRYEPSLILKTADLYFNAETPFRV